MKQILNDQQPPSFRAGYIKEQRPLFVLSWLGSNVKVDEAIRGIGYVKILKHSYPQGQPFNATLLR